MSKYPGRIVTDLAPAGYSVFFDGSGDFLTVTYPVNWSTYGSYTLEFWYYTTSIAATNFGFVSIGGTGYTNFYMYGSSGAYPGAVAVGIQGTNEIRSANSVIAANTWYHIAYTFDGTTTRIFVNGVLVASGTTAVYANNSANLVIGNGLSNNYTLGNISNLRLVQGTALYTAAFTPPTQLLRVTNTQLLTCNSPAIIDQSSNAFAITPSGNAAVSTLTPFTAYVPYNPALGASTPGVWTVDEAMQAAATRQWNMYDPYFNLTTLLLHGNGTNGAQNNTFLDSSSNNFTITRNGNTTQGTFSPFSQTGWSNFFVASASSTIGFANNAAFQFGAPSGNANDFVVEFFVYPTTTAISAPVHTGYTSGTTYWGFGLNRTSGGANTAGQVQFFLTDSFSLQATTGLVANQQNHICAVRTGTTVSLFVNGIRQATGTSSVNPNPTGLLYVGGEALSLGRYLDGYVSNLRIIKGATLPYDANSLSITVPITQLTTITGTTVLTCQSNRFADASSSALPVPTITGTPSVQAFSPFLPTVAYTPQTIGGSGYFDGTTDFLSVATNAALTVTGNVDACFEAWIYPTATPGATATVLQKSGISGSVFPNYELGFSSSRLLVLFGGNSGSPGSSVFTLNGATTLPLNAWSHVVGTKRYVGGGSGNEYRVFVNGKLDGYVTAANISDGNAQAFTLGAQPSGTAFTGYISGSRVFNTSIPASYQTTSTTVGTQIFTSPTAPATAGTASILCNFTNAGVVDSTADNVLETVGNAQISTTQSKFGGSSMYFDGTGDWLIVPNNAFYNFGSSDFTIEFWWYPNTTADQNLISKWNSGTEWILQWRNAGNFRWAANGSVVRDATYTLSTGAWIHVAVSCASGNLRIFVNGTQIGTTATQSSITTTTEPVVIGAGQLSSTPLAVNGYFDEVRITRFARYTGAFTPQTSQWQDQ